jgi:menaquinone-specific isochorismate synthase
MHDLRGRLIAVRRWLPSVSPWTFLRNFQGGPRGFWARGGGWIGHVGALATIRPDPEDTGANRGASVAHALSMLAEVEGTDPLRVFGGMAFRASAPGDGLWTGFPEYHFQLPELELHTEGETLGLVGRARIAPGESRSEARARLEAKLDRIERQVTRGDSVVDEEPASAVQLEEGPTDRKAWRSLVRRALTAIDDDELRKVVLARAVRCLPVGGCSALAVAGRLHAQNPKARVFYYEPTVGAVFLGASPETLVRLSGREVRATAVAGSIARGTTPEEDQRLAGELLASDKDRREHDMVVRDMVERLEGHGAQVQSELAPHVLTLSGIQHLETSIRAELPRRTDVLELLELLHPTPAVCGQPRDAAYSFLERQEGFPRGWYGGPVGWMDTHGNGVFAPALRCGLMTEGAWYLFAGAGIVRGSDPDREWDEIHLKLDTVVRALTGGTAG